MLHFRKIKEKKKEKLKIALLMTINRSINLEVHYLTKSSLSICNEANM